MRQGSKMRKIWLIVLAVMAVLFMVLTQSVGRHTGVQFHGTLLKMQGTVENGAYFGKAHGEDVSIVVSRHSETEVGMELYISNVAHENWLVEYPLESIMTEHDREVAGLRVSRNGEVVFEGGYDPDYRVESSYILYDAAGEWDAGNLISVSAKSGQSGYWADYETSLNTVLKFVNGPEIKARGDFSIWFYGLVMSALAAALVAFPDALFQWNHRWHVKDPEPTDFYYVENCIGAGVASIFALAMYIAGVCTVP